MVSVDDLSPGRPLPGPILVRVDDVHWNPGRARRAVVHLADRDGNPLRLVDYEGAEITATWELHHRYCISRCRVQQGGDGYAIELAPSKRTRIEPLGPDEASTTLLVVGDSHFGRREHPKTGEPIDPIEAVSTATRFAITQEVDAVVHTGDIFHDTATPVTAYYAEKEIFEPLAEREIPFYYVQGNHRAEAGDTLLANRAGEMVSQLDTAGSVVNNAVRLFGIKHHADGNIPVNTLGFPSSVKEPVSILVLHQTLDYLSGQSVQSVDLGNILRQYVPGFDAVVSGHHHDAMISDRDGVTVMYAGASERMSTNSQPVDRVAWLLTIADGTVACERYDIP